MCHLIDSEYFHYKIRNIQHIVEVPIVKVGPTIPFGWDLKVSNHEDGWTTVSM